VPTDLDAQLEAAWRVRQACFEPQIVFAYPVDTALVSVTGPQCALDCAHCGGHYLRHMQSIEEADAGDAPSVLISGGCDPQGRVPVVEVLDRVAGLRASRPPGRPFNWHLGLIDASTADAVAGVMAPGDVVSFDVVGDRQTIQEVYGLDATPGDYEATYRLLRRTLSPTVRVVPHVTIGLRGGQLGHERAAMDALARCGLDTLVMLVLIPTPGTRYADRSPPEVEEVALLLAEARQRFPNVPLHLGCMRPRRVYRARLDPLAVRAGVNVLVSPSREGKDAAQVLGLQVVKTRECCVFA
jgi:uncharacterized radical SAM superfamily protein